MFLINLKLVTEGSGVKIGVEIVMAITEILTVEGAEILV